MVKKSYEHGMAKMLNWDIEFRKAVTEMTNSMAIEIDKARERCRTPYEVQEMLNAHTAVHDMKYDALRQQFGYPPMKWAKTNDSDNQ